VWLLLATRILTIERIRMSAKAAMPSRGAVAPTIEAPTATGGHFSLAEQAGKWVVIFFYPMANTPG
jgi:hypothetical protein